jgi:hypothetical protein
MNQKVFAHSLAHVVSNHVSYLIVSYPIVSGLCMFHCVLPLPRCHVRHPCTHYSTHQLPTIHHPYTQTRSNPSPRNKAPAQPYISRSKVKHKERDRRKGEGGRGNEPCRCLGCSVYKSKGSKKELRVLMCVRSVSYIITRMR